MGFFAVPVTGDWATPANCWADIGTATGMLVDTESDWSTTLYIYLWEGEGDPNDYAALVATPDGASYEPYGSNTPFTSPPSSGTAYIVGMMVEKTHIDGGIG